jgi:PAS domain S-box-containing protein
MNETSSSDESLGLESSSTLLDPAANDSVFAISKSIFELSEALMSATSDEVPELMREGLERLRRRMMVDRVWVARVVQGGASRTTYEAYADGLESNVELESSLDADDLETLRSRLERNEPQYLAPGEAIPADTERARPVAQQRVDDDLNLIPLVHDGELKAVLGVQRRDADAALAPEIRTLLEGAAGVFLQAIVLDEVQSELAASQRKYQQLVDTIGEVFFEVDADGNWSFLSKYWGEMAGVDPASSIGEPMLDSFDDYEQTDLEALLRGEVEDDDSRELEVRLVEDHAEPRWVRLVVKPAYGDDGRFGGVRGAIRDVSRSRESVADLQQVDRLVNFGTLAAGIGHELNNPLAFVLGNLDFAAGTLSTVKRKLEASARNHPDDADLDDTLSLVDEISEATRDMKDGARRLREIVSDLRMFTRVDANGDSDPIDLREPVESAVSIGFSEIRHRATLIREFAGQIPAVEVNRGRISQVFLNLLVNAAQAFSENSGDDNRIWLRLYDEDDWVIAEVEDNGPGMSEQVRSRIFEAFYTTKDASEGTGLGLSICKSLVESAGGRIEVESEPGEGSLFRIRLPVARGDAPEGPDSSASPSGGLPRLRVLVVDDEPAVSRTIQRMLGSKHELATVSDARIALEALRAGNEYDVILCDIVMPRMSGEEFFEVVTDEFDELVERIIFMTGGASMDIVSRMREKSRQPILEKPFTRRELRDACAALIRGMMARGIE